MPVVGSLLRKGLALILPHERKAVEEQWLSLHYEPFWATQTFWWGTFSAVLAVVIILGLILVWSQSLKKQVAQRTKVLSSINTVLLDSLKCHTEKEVMECCLFQANELSASTYTVWAELSEGGVLANLLDVASEDNDVEKDVIETVCLAPSQLAELEQAGAIHHQVEPRDGHPPVGMVVVTIAVDGDEAASGSYAGRNQVGFRDDLCL